MYPNFEIPSIIIVVHALTSSANLGWVWGCRSFCNTLPLKCSYCVAKTTFYDASFYDFYAPGLKGPSGASSVWIVRPSVRLSVRNSVPLTFKVQYLKFRWSCSNQTWTVSSSKGCSPFTDITYAWGWGGVNIWDLENLPYLTLLPPGASVFHKHMSSCFGVCIEFPSSSPGRPLLCW